MSVNAQETLHHLYCLLGEVVLLPIALGKKGPHRAGWQTITYADTQADDYQRDLIQAAQRGGNIGVLLGPRSGRLLAIDLDDEKAVQDWLKRYSWLQDTLRSRGQRGCQCWLRLEPFCVYPNGKAVYPLTNSTGQKIGEVRLGGAGGAQSVIWGVHPKGMNYQILVEKEPIEISLANLDEFAPEILAPQKPGPVMPLPPRLDYQSGGDLEARVHAYLDQCEPAKDGERGHDTTFRVACQIVNGFALDPETALRFMRHYNQKCEPPWSEKELQHKVDEALKARHNKAPGYLLDQQPPATRPTGSPTPQPNPVELRAKNENIPQGQQSAASQTPIYEEVVSAALERAPEIGPKEGLEGNEPEEPEKLFFYPKLDAKAFYGPFGGIVKAIAPLTEADPAAVLIQLLVGWGNLIGRSAYFSIGSTKHFTNLFCCIVGRTAKARKGLALGVAQWVLDQIDPQWVKANIRSGLSSGEGLIWRVRDSIIKTQPIKEKGRYTGQIQTYVEDEGIKDKRLLVAETEFGSALSVMGRSGNTLSAVIRDAFDSKEELGSLVKNSPCVATGAHISIIEQITGHELRIRMKECEQWDGFANRFMWPCARRSQVMSDPPDLSQAGLSTELSELVDTTQWAKQVEEMERDEEATQLWDVVYRQFAEDDTEDVVSATTDRGDVIMLRLQMLYALSSGARIIKREHVEAASALWKYAEDSARYLFGARLGNPKAEKIFDALRHAPAGMTRWDLSNIVFKRNVKTDVIEEALNLLKKIGWIVSQTEKTDGRDAERFLAKK
jgi:hypothetical protein